MLKLVTYQTMTGLRQSLQTYLASGPIKIVTSFPAKADALRNSWSTRTESDVITFSRFISELFEQQPDSLEGPWRKSKLLLQLNAFRNLLELTKESSYGQFKMSYQVFSDLRAYVVSDDFPDELLIYFDQEVAAMAQLFHKAIRSLGILDEHGAIFELTQRLRDTDGLRIPNTPTIIFDGFTFMTPVQISFLEALSIRHDVIVPIPDLVMQNAHDYDWIKVLELSASEIVQLDKANSRTKEIKAVSFSLGNMPETLKLLIGEEPKKSQFVLASKNLDPLNIQEIPFSNIFIKTATDLTADARDKVFSKFELKLGTLKSVPEATKILEWIDEEKVILIKEKKLENLKEIAVLNLIEKAIQSVPSCLNEQRLDNFLLNLLKDVITLDAPRNNLISISEEEFQTKILSLKDLYNLDKHSPTYLCVSSNYGHIKSDYRPFSPDMENTLAKIGPVRRPELDFLFQQATLQEIWEIDDLTLIIENGLLDHDMGWKKVLSEFEINFENTIPSNPTKANDYSFFESDQSLVVAPRTISASRIQDFLDCPKKYFASRIDKIIPLVKQNLEVDVMTIGMIEHELIEVAWKNGENWWAKVENLEKEALSLIKSYDQYKKISPVILASVVHEASLYAQNGLIALKEIHSIFPEMVFEFAVKLENPDRTGEIDCLGTSHNQILILDFKRSLGSNPSFNSWTGDFPKIQLWFYLKSLYDLGKLNFEQEVMTGYLFLKDIGDSWIAQNFDLSSSQLSDNLLIKYKYLESFVEDFDQYRAFEESTISNLKSEFNFKPKPRYSEICDFCSLNSVCPSSGNEEGEE
jgi:hypothetical protein